MYYPSDLACLFFLAETVLATRRYESDEAGHIDSLSSQSGGVRVTAGRFQDRAEVGRLPATKVQAYANRPGVLVLALPLGGTP